MSDDAEHERQAREEFRRLWDFDEDVRPGPRPTHTAREIARAGIAMADRDGLAALTMRKVSAQLSVSAMSLYNQVPGKAELIEVMVDEVMGEAIPSLQTDWQASVEAVAWTNWHCFVRHPWLLNLERHRPVLGPNILRKYQQEMTAFEGLGLSDIEMDFALGSLLALVRGCVAPAIDANGTLRSRGESDLDWWKFRQPLLAKMQVDEKHLFTTRVGVAIGEFTQGAQSPEHSFRFGLAMWLSGTAELVSQRAKYRAAPPI